MNHLETVAKYEEILADANIRRMAITKAMIETNLVMAKDLMEADETIAEAEHVLFHVRPKVVAQMQKSIGEQRKDACPEQNHKGAVGVVGADKDEAEATKAAAIDALANFMRERFGATPMPS
jgi:hypothetical protein